MKLLMGKSLIHKAKEHGIYGNIRDAEFKVFSQFGDDGIIQYLINSMSIEEKEFIEFGCGDYMEANTRFLLLNDNWRGLVIDSNRKDIQRIRRQDIYWRHDLQVVQAFVDRENINEIFSNCGFSGRIGLMSIDIDGNDYWIWEAISVVMPAVVICEYNSVLGAANAITVPYNPRFERTGAHPSNLYWGCSLKALCVLAEKKGYCLVGCNSHGNNAYFVRNDSLGDLKQVTAEEGYIESKFRESRDSRGRLTYISGRERLRVIEDMPVIDIEAKNQITIKALCRKS